jgi:hypothetical protein
MLGRPSYASSTRSTPVTERNAMGEKLYTVAEQSLHFLTRKHDGFPTTEIACAAAWITADLPPLEALRTPVPDEVLGCFRAILGKNPLADFDPANSQCDRVISDAVNAWARELRCGRGFVLLGGLPVWEWSLDQARSFMALFGSRFGILGQQNPRGDVIGEVRNTGAALSNPAARNYITVREFKPHCYASDQQPAAANPVLSPR